MHRLSFLVFLLCTHALGAVVDFEKEVWPILEERCVECHKAPYELNGKLKEPKSGLRLDGAAYIMHGGDDGPVVVADHPSRSSLYQRVILTDDDSDLMPPKGDPLSHSQKEILRKWIAQGLDFGKWEGQTDGIDKLKLRKKEAGSAFIPEYLVLYEQLSKGLEPLPEEKLLAIAKASGLMIRPIGLGNPLLEARVVTKPYSIGDEQVLELRPLAGHIAKLDLRNTAVTAQACSEISAFGKLTELNLRGTRIGDSGIPPLTRLPILQTLNLCETSVSDKGVSALGKARSLRKVYLWNSKATPKGLGRLEKLLDQRRP